ncbi:tyrosine phosphatase family protein [Mesorhizobium sp. LHD-90]|uniref:tyrosine phosphatase family protein n=1 Tax=Mesorhizobium sp. LHD-90 TaxID=3071414 RepID=UPI0027E01C9B|nr:tyrosine phosphatase family protein [Mesorhizobium sp. LHD-90]MDQ6438224.1 tyrosine phosphatase family protein [Mesorhizobium sp. LHD-90]
MIYVCPLSRIDETVSLTGAEWMLSLLSEGTMVTRPAAILADRHLHLKMHDIAEAQEGFTLPGEEHVRSLIDFGHAWDRRKPLIIHCFAGISRSTASAYIIAAALVPERDEAELAATLRKLSPSATPNPRLISLADQMLGRENRMVEAVKSIGRGADAGEGVPFGLKLEA